MADNFSSVTTDEKPKGTIFFLKTVKNSDNLQQAFESLSSDFFNPRWIDLKEVKRLSNEAPGNVLVVDSIDTKQFRKVRRVCRRKKCDTAFPRFTLRIFTAYALLSINPRRLECLPLSRYPIVSTCMKGLRVVTSGFGPKRSRELKKLVVSMGGIAQHGLLRSTNLLISTTWTSQKVMCWRKSELPELPVVTPEWIERCYEMREDIKDAKDLIKGFKLRTFSGMHFCVSGFNTEIRSKICKAVREHGGTYSQGLSLPTYKFGGQTQSRSQVDPKKEPTTTHLIVAHKSGIKYEYAMDLSEDEMHIVNYDWFLVSRTKEYPQVESDPKYCARDPEIMKELKRREQEKKQRAILCSSLISDSANNSRAQIHLSSQDLPKTAPPVDPIIEIEKLLSSTVISGLNVFYELSFFICGLSSVNYSTVKKLIGRAGGTVYTNLVASVSHVIIGPNMTSKEALSVKRHDEKVRPVAKVDIEWVVHCVKERKLLPESINSASSKLLGRINSTQDLDPEEKKQINRERGESKAYDMDVKLRELEASSGKRVASKSKGLAMGKGQSEDRTQYPAFMITKNQNDDSISCSIPVRYGSPDR